MPKHVIYNGRMITQDRMNELQSLPDDKLVRRIAVSQKMCDALQAVEDEFGPMWPEHERSHWSLRLIDYLREADKRYGKDYPF